MYELHLYQNNVGDGGPLYDILEINVTLLKDADTVCDAFIFYIINIIIKKRKNGRRV